MKFQRSLKLYFLAAIFFIGSLSIFGMSSIAIKYFFAGLDLAMVGSMRNDALIAKPLDGKPVHHGEITIATRWQDLPQEIKAIFKDADIKINELTKHIEKLPLLSPPDVAYFAIRFNFNGKIRYASITLPKIARTYFGSDGDIEHLHTPHFTYILLATFSVLSLFFIAMMLTFRFVASPIKALRAWAKSLDKEKLNQPIPDFHYIELNSLAKIVQSSLNSVQQGLNREQRFLGYASHELRTPIAVTRTNTELLRKLIEKDAPKEKQEEVLNRIERALFTMTDLTETLLWLNRQENKSLPTQEIEIGALTEQINHELSYLLKGKDVQVNISTDNFRLALPQALVRIIITNLIRNAFQHTQNGTVNIAQLGEELSIENSNATHQENQEALGFGLGLALTERLIIQYGWYYENIETPTGRKVKIIFA